VDKSRLEDETPRDGLLKGKPPGATRPILLGGLALARLSVGVGPAVLCAGSLSLMTLKESICQISLFFVHNEIAIDMRVNDKLLKNVNTTDLLK